MMGWLMSTRRHSQVFFPAFFFFAREQRQWFDKGSNCIFSMACIAIQTIHPQFLTEHKSLCSHNGQRGLQRQSRGDNTQVVLLQPAQSLTQTEQCLLIAVNALHFFGWQKITYLISRSSPREHGPLWKHYLHQWTDRGVSHQCHRPNGVLEVHVFAHVPHWPCLSGSVTCIKRWRNHNVSKDLPL